MLQITDADSNSVYVDNGKFITKDDTKIYNSSNPKDVFKVWTTYLDGNGTVMTESTKKDLIGKYVDVNQDGEKWRLLFGGSRYSRKKSSKRIRSMKKVGSKFRKYSRRK
jgi:flagellar hook assembly protein FlgD